MNLSTLRERCKVRFRDPDNILVTDPEWDDHINAAYFEVFQAARWPFTLTSVDKTLTAGTKTIELDDVELEHLQDIYDVTQDSALVPFGAHSDAVKIRGRTFLEARNSRPVFYQVVGRRLNIFPGAAANHTIRVYHYTTGEPGRLTTDGDTPAMPERFHEALVSGAVAKAHADDLNNESWRAYREEFMAILQQMYLELRPIGITHEWLERRLAINQGLAGGNGVPLEQRVQT